MGLSHACLVIILAALAAPCRGVNRYTPDWPSLDTRPTPPWYDEAKFGIFLHWGVFSVPSFWSEWFWYSWQVTKEPACVKFMKDNYRPGFMYQDFAPQFTAEFFDPDRWADIFHRAGARYVVLTGKHHEGYTLWPSNVSWNWNAQDVGPKRDLVGDLAAAVRRKGDMRFGVYHSMMDWFHPFYLADKASGWQTQDFPRAKALPELVEIVERYHPDIVWSDGEWEAPDTYWNSTSFLAWLYNDSPVRSSVVVNDRWGKGVRCKHGDFFNCDDQFNPGVLQEHKWESCIPVDTRSWGYRRNADIADYRTIGELLDSLVSTVSCNGNLLLNVGPTKDGRIDPAFEERLLQMGTWLGVNGEAVYGSRPWKHQNDSATPHVWYTAKGEVVYVSVLRWPKNDLLFLESLELSPSARVTMLGLLEEQPLQWNPRRSVERFGDSDVDSTSRSGTTVLFPQLTPDKLPTPWAWVLKVEGAL